MLLASGLAVGGTGVVAAGAPASPPVPAQSTASVVGLAKGAYGDNVRALQDALNRVGIGVKYGVDGYFGSATQASVRAFQRSKGLTVTGAVDTITAQALGFSTGSSGSGTTSGSGSSGGVPAGSGGGSALLAVGSSGASVKQLQQLLISAGQDVGGGIDGVYGQMTAAAVKRFQQAKGLAATGKVDTATMQALQAAAGSTTAPAGTLAQGARGGEVKAVQQALIAAGISVTGGADGIYGSATVNAVKQFQQAKGLLATGAVDAQTRAALGTGGATQPAAPAAAAAPAAPASGLQQGARGPAVTALQKALISMGWTLVGGADGVFGANTKAVLIKAQRANGVPASGVVDDATARLFNLTATPNPATTAQPAAGGSTAAGFAAYDERGARTVALQKALLAAGIPLRGGADGNFGSGTASGIMAFQKAAGLPATGKVDASTAAALGLSPMDPPAAGPSIDVALQAKPVQGPCYYGDTWTAARSNGRVHIGTDIMAKEGNELYAVYSGTVTKLYSPTTDVLTGNGLRVARADGTYAFYGHLSALAPGIGVGTPVSAGQLIGYVGKTGNAGSPHLHIEIHPGGGAAVNPYPIVKAIGAC